MRLRRPLRHRSSRRELLDADELEPGALAANLRDLARLNRLPGGTRASIAAIRRLAGDDGPLTILDAGTGAADMPLAFEREGRRRGGWQVLALERHPTILAHAQRRVARRPGVTLLKGEACRLPLADDSVDVAHASLLIHHLEPADARRALAEMARVARRGVVVNDLRRGLLPLALTATVALTLGRAAYTRHDGIVSALRAYRLDELDELLGDADLRVVWRSPAILPRVVTAAVRRRPA
ncbi:MAG TPA: methyltransferase domain-containing protein, partial [Candidatus Limnocylindria bacterium]|nr:methyltransferase domain-containing protein [Candidatus Limnocylindria bacterium]